MKFIKYLLLWISGNLSIPFWMVGHIHLTMNVYEDIYEVLASFGMNIIVAIGFWISWKDYKKAMKEKEVLKETHRSVKPVLGEKPKKRYYKPKKKKVEEKHQDVLVDNSEMPYLKPSNNIKIPKYVGKYCLPDDRGVCVSFEKKPKWLHRKFMSLLLGITWTDKK
jgi:hypothetical protein